MQDSNLAELALSQEEMHMNSTHKGSKTDLQTNLNVASGFERKGTLKVVESVSHETLNENNKIADELSNEVC